MMAHQLKFDLARPNKSGLSRLRSTAVKSNNARLEMSLNIAMIDMPLGTESASHICMRYVTKDGRSKSSKAPIPSHVVTEIFAFIIEAASTEELKPVVDLARATFGFGTSADDG